MICIKETGKPIGFCHDLLRANLGEKPGRPMAIFKQDILGCFLILSICVVLSIGVNALSNNGIALIGQWNPEKGVVMAGANKAHAVDVTQINYPLKVKQMVESGKTIVLDVRWPEIYDQGHIPGALNLSMDNFQGETQADDSVYKNPGSAQNEKRKYFNNLLRLSYKDKKVLLSEITPEDEILVYCAGVTCHDSHTFATHLVEMGFNRVAVYAGGFAEWEEMGFDVAQKGSAP